MIAQLFPGRTRHHIKLKYKTEERKHPMRFHDALANQSKGKLNPSLLSPSSCIISQCFLF